MRDCFTSYSRFLLALIPLLIAKAVLYANNVNDSIAVTSNQPSGTYIKGNIGILDDNKISFAGDILVLDRAAFVNATSKGKERSAIVLLNEGSSPFGSTGETPKPTTLAQLNDIWLASKSVTGSASPLTKANKAPTDKTRVLIVESIPYNQGASPVSGSSGTGGWAICPNQYWGLSEYSNSGKNNFAHFFKYSNTTLENAPPPPEKNMG